MIKQLVTHPARDKSTSPQQLKNAAHGAIKSLVRRLRGDAVARRRAWKLFLTKQSSPNQKRDASALRRRRTQDVERGAMGLPQDRLQNLQDDNRLKQETGRKTCYVHAEDQICGQWEMTALDRRWP